MVRGWLKWIMGLKNVYLNINYISVRLLKLCSHVINFLLNLYLFIGERLVYD